MIDLKITPDGDLILGNQDIDEENMLLFYINQKPESAGIVTTSPNEDSVPIRDAELSYNDDTNIQLLSSIFRTDSPDWYLYPELGANISELTGELNTRVTGEKGKEMIMKAITADNSFESGNVDIEAIPVSENEILYDIKIRTIENVLRYTYLLNLEIGVLNYYEVNN